MRGRVDIFLMTEALSTLLARVEKSLDKVVDKELFRRDESGRPGRRSVVETQYAGFVVPAQPVEHSARGHREEGRKPGHLPVSLHNLIQGCG